MLRALGWIFGTLIALIGAALVALMLIDWNALRDEVAELGSDVLGRKVELGALDIEPGWTTRVHVGHLKVGNTQWGHAKALLTLEEGEIAVRVLPLLTGHREIPELVLHKPVVALETDSNGRANWRLFGAGKQAKPQGQAGLPRHVRIEDGTLSYRDARRDLDVHGKITTGRIDAATGKPLSVALQGSLEDRPLRLDITGVSPLSPGHTRDRYPVQVDLRFAKTSVQAHGTVLDPARPAFSLDLTVEGPSLADVLPVLGFKVPDTPDYRLSGTLQYQEKLWRLSGLELKLGDSDLSGSVTLDQRRDKPYLKADLTSQQLDLDKLDGLGAAAPGAKPSKSGTDLFPAIAIPDRHLHTVNMDITFNGGQLIAHGLPIDEPQLHVRLVDGRAEADSLSLKVGGGTVAGQLALNAREKVPSADADLTLSAIDLKPLFQDTRFVQEMGGRFSGRLYILGVGESLHAMLASARGEGSVAMRGGSISGLMVEALGLDVAEALGLAIGHDVRVGIRCGRADVDLDHGKAALTRFLLDTTDSLLVATGSADLGKETLDVQVETRAKDFSLIDATAPVKVKGTFSKPQVEIGDIDSFPFFDPGDQEDLDCRTLLGNVTEPAHRDADSN